EEIFSESDDAQGIIFPDGSYLVFDSDERLRENECLLHVSFNKPDGSWTKSVSMGKHIKQKTAIAWIGYDWKYIFFKANGNI
ncbi:MAG: hypothetical protein KAW56_16545, partial [Candidatus Marinimicrobia bacterium]|nr:hypothetical protein [Candidatus Neomarinimicrobiota bacterium]